MKCEKEIKDEVKRLRYRIRKQWDETLGQPLSQLQEKLDEAQISVLEWVLEDSDYWDKRTQNQKVGKL